MAMTSWRKIRRKGGKIGDLLPRSLGCELNLNLDTQHGTWAVRADDTEFAIEEGRAGVYGLQGERSRRVTGSWMRFLNTIYLSTIRCRYVGPSLIREIRDTRYEIRG